MYQAKLTMGMLLLNMVRAASRMHGHMRMLALPEPAAQLSAEPYHSSISTWG
jgi:hypothetical protein